MARRILRERKTDYLWILVGTALMAMSANFFFSPMGVVPGGFTGLGLIIEHLAGLPLWLSNILLNIPLFIFAVRGRGWKFMRRTVVASALFSAWLAVIPEIDLAEGDLFLTAVIGGGLMGLGLGLIFLGKATTGGTDTLAALLNRLLPALSTAKILPFCDGAVILGSIPIFGISRSLYAVISVILCGLIADGIVAGLRNAKTAYIISDEHAQIAAAIISELDRSATLLEGTGVYTGERKPVIYCAISRKQTVLLKEIVAQIDPTAFMILTDASEIRGEGFLKYTMDEI